MLFNSFRNYKWSLCAIRRVLNWYFTDLTIGNSTEIAVDSSLDITGMSGSFSHHNNSSQISKFITYFHFLNFSR